MKDRKKISIAISIVVLILIGGYFIHKNSLNKKINNINELSEKDKTILKNVAKDKKVESTCVEHTDDTVILKIKFKEGVKSEEQYKITVEYMNKLKEQYPDKKVNTTIVND